MSTATSIARLCALCLAFTLAPAYADDKDDDKDKEPVNSGFLGDDSVYDKLQEVDLGNKLTAQRWLGPDLNFSNYQSVLIDDVLLYPEPEPGPQVSADTLDQIRTYLTTELNKKVSAVLNVADTAGPGVLRMQSAITGVAVKTEGMKAYEVVPVAAIFGGIKAATGKRDRNVHVFVEARFVDSVSGDLVGAGVRRLSGDDLKGKKDQLELSDMQDSLDEMTDDVSATAAGALKDNSEAGET